MQLANELVHILPPELAVVAVAALPVIELRGAVPVGLALGIHPLSVFVLSLAGNMLPMPFVFYLLDPFTRRVRRSPQVSKIVEEYYSRTRAKSDQIKKYGFWGLVIFVGMPLPGTGAWTGVIAASLLGLRFGQTMAALALGTAVAGAIVLAVSLLGFGMLSL